MDPLWDSKEDGREVNIFLIALFFISPPSWAVTKLPELAAKQAINNLRFLSSDGSFTYYQNREGSLLLSTNYSVKEVIKAPPGSNYEVVATPNRKNIIVLVQENFHRYLSIKQTKKVYKVSFGKRNSELIGEGLSAKIHGKNDEWVSIYHPMTKEIKFINLKSTAFTFVIKLENLYNPYFIPDVVMTNGSTVIFTDLNKAGLTGVLYYDRVTKKIKVLYKASNAATKLELCLDEKKLYLGEFGLDDIYSGSIISRLDLKTIDFSRREIIYKSSLNDLGNIQCKGHLFFIKNLSKKREKLAYEVVQFISKSEEPRIISDINFASHIIDMDGVLLLPNLGKYYVLKGMSDFSKVDLLINNKSKEGQK